MRPRNGSTRVMGSMHSRAKDLSKRKEGLLINMSITQASSMSFADSSSGIIQSVKSIPLAQFLEGNASALDDINSAFINIQKGSTVLSFFYTRCTYIQNDLSRSFLRSLYELGMLLKQHL